MAYSDEIAGMDTQAKNSEGHIYGNYQAAVDANSEIEQKIGLSLAKNSKLTDLAKKINEKAKIPTFDQSSRPDQPQMDLTDKLQIEGQRDSFGGARASAEGWDTLGRSVHEAMHVIEKDKAKYSKVQAGNTANPYFGRPKSRKPEFDQPIADYKWEQLPPQIQEDLSGMHDFKGAGLIKAYNALSSDIRRSVILNDYRYKNKSIDKTAIVFLASDISADIIASVKKIVDDPKNAKLRAATKIQILQAMGAAPDDQKAQLAALLDIVIDKHTSGDHTNIVSRNGDGGVKDQWIEDTVIAGKPIISGPSGHTLRYLNFWAEKRNENIVEAQDQNEWPSLEAARLVMMADLLPPRHHSYDEVMTASIGIKDKTKQPGTHLMYQHKSSYDDIKKENVKDTNLHSIVEDAYELTGAKGVKGNGNIDKIIGKRATINKSEADLLTTLHAIPDPKRRINAIKAAIKAATTVAQQQIIEQRE